MAHFMDGDAVEVPIVHSDDFRQAQDQTRKFDRVGDDGAINEAIAAWNKILNDTRFPNAPKQFRRAAFGAAANVFIRRFRYVSSRSADLDQAVTLFENAIALSPLDSAERAGYLSNLGTTLRDRYLLDRKPADLNEAIDTFRAAIAMMPNALSVPGILLSNLAIALKDRYVLKRNPGDLDEAITLWEKAKWSAVSSAERAAVLDGLGVGLSERFALKEQYKDLYDAILAHQEAVKLTPFGSPDLASRLNNLAGCFVDLYTLVTGNVDDLNTAIVTLEGVERNVLPSSPQHTKVLYDLGLGLRDRFIATGNLEDLEKSHYLCREAQLLARESDPVVALRAARTWANVALRRGLWEEANEAAQNGREILERLNEVGASADEKTTWLHEVPGLAATGAYAAARLHNPTRAALLLEMGQTKALNAFLDRGRDRVKLVESTGEAATQFAWNTLTAMVAAMSQPLVYLATTEVGSLILLLYLKGGSVVTEPIWIDMTEGDLKRLQIRRAVEKANAGKVVGGLLLGQVLNVGLQSELDIALPQLGQQLIAPLAARLRELAVTAVTLIPGGWLNLLPLHAATYEVDGEERVFLDEFAVSYAPSANAAERSRTRSAAYGPVGSPALVVGNPMPVDEPLFSARGEAEIVAGFFGATPLLETEATRPAVWAAMPGQKLLHFACHGLFSPHFPRRSGLLLAHREWLTLEAIRQLPLAGARLAVLSACQTSLTDYRELPDEAVGLPAAFLQAGAAGIVATLWPVDEASTPLLMEQFYRRLLAGATPAEALRQAQRRLRTMTRQEISDDYLARMSPAAEWAAAAHADLPPGRPEDCVYAHPYYWAGFTYTGG